MTVKKSAGAFLKMLSMEELPSDEENKWLDALKEQYRGEVSVRYTVYPYPIGPIPKDWKSLGTTYSVEFPNGQILSVTISKGGEIIKRSYTDRGDIHLRDVSKTIRDWQKSIEQIQRGGRRNPELSAIDDEWKASGYNPAIKRQLKKNYLAKHEEEDEAEERFDRYMKRRKQGDISPQ